MIRLRSIAMMATIRRTGLGCSEALTSYSWVVGGGVHFVVDCNDAVAIPVCGNRLLAKSWWWRQLSPCSCPRLERKCACVQSGRRVTADHHKFTAC